MDKEPERELVRGKQIEVIFEGDDTPSVYATNITVRHTEHEFIIGFYEALPPLILGSEEERSQQLAELQKVRAQCVARVSVAASRMGDFVRALQGNYTAYVETFGQKDTGDE